MNSITLAAVYRSTDCNRVNDSSFDRYPKLRIAGRDVQFLIDVLRQQSTFHDISEHVWRLDFFEHSRFRQTLYVSVVSIEPQGDMLDHKGINETAKVLKKQAYSQICKFLDTPREVVKATFIQTSDYEPSNNVILTASQLIRGTNSMQYDKLERHSDRFIHVDGRGTVLLSPRALHFSTFKRQVILLSLSKAYLLAMNEIMNSLANQCENSKDLKNLYKAALIFNAKYYFANPVKVNRYDAFQLWQGIRQCMKIDDINREVIQQLKAVHQILGEEEDAKQLRAELRLNKRIGWLGIGIGILSLISLIEITPEKVTDFVSTWWLWLSSFFTV